MSKVFDQAELAIQLEQYPSWKNEGDLISRSFRLESFKEAIAFVNSLADLAEEANHHPEIRINYRTVALTLTTHDCGGVTPRDLALARKIEGLL